MQHTLRYALGQPFRLPRAADLRLCHNNRNRLAQGRPSSSWLTVKRVNFDKTGCTHEMANSIDVSKDNIKGNRVLP